MKSRKLSALVFLFGLFCLLLSACVSSARSEPLLSYAVVYNGTEYCVPNAQWWSTVSELSKTLKFSTKDLVPVPEVQGQYRLEKSVRFSNPSCTAETVFIFQDGYYIGRDLIINCQSQEEYLAVCSSLATQAASLPSPAAGSLGDLAQGYGTAQWRGGSNNSFTINTLPGTGNGVVLLSVRAPHSH